MDHLPPDVPPIFQQFTHGSVQPWELDALLAAGWRHFGRDFFRYSLRVDDVTGTKRLQVVQPLRIRLSEFRHRQSHRRILRRNQEIRWEVTPLQAGPAVQEMFHRHKARFQSNIPEDLRVFVPLEPRLHPCTCCEFHAWLGNELIAASFLDRGQSATSSIYGLFEPAQHRRSPGILTMLKEIEFSLGSGYEFYYPGYATREPSHYDYKKQFHGIEALNWHTGEWQPLE